MRNNRSIEALESPLPNTPDFTSAFQTPSPKSARLETSQFSAFLSAQAAPFLTSDDCARYDRDGVICIRNVFSETEVEALRGDIKAQLDPATPLPFRIDFERLRRDIWHPDPYEMRETQAAFLGVPDRAETQYQRMLTQFKMILDTDPEARENIDPVLETQESTDLSNQMGAYWVALRLWPQVPNIKNMACESVLPAICAALMRSDSLCLWSDTLRVKEPRTAQRMSLHQDWAYFPFTGLQSCSAWVALDPVSRANGGPYHIRGSHNWGKTYATNLLMTATPNPLSLYEPMPDFERNLDELDRVEYDLNPGDVIIHHPLILHGSHGNVTAHQDRRAISFRYCGDDIRYFDKPGALTTSFLKPNPPQGSRLCPDLFPSVWPQMPQD